MGKKYQHVILSIAMFITFIFIAGIPKIAFSATPGTIKWKVGLGNYYNNSGCIAIGKDGTIYIDAYNYTDNNNYLYAINSDGSIKWKIGLGNYYNNPGFIAIDKDGTIYIDAYNYTTTNNNYLYAINSNSGGLADSPWPEYGHDNQNTGNVLTNNNSFYSNYNVSINPSLVNFGNVTIGATSSRDITIENKGTEDIYLTDISIVGANSTSFVSLNGTSTLIPAGSSLSLNVQFTPQYQGAENAILHIQLNNSEKESFNVTLEGNSIQPQITKIEPLVPTEKIIYNPIILPKYINVYFVATFDRDISGEVDNSTIANYFDISSDDTNIYVYPNKLLESNKVLIRVQVPTDYIINNSYYTLSSKNGSGALVELQKSVVPITYRMAVIPQVNTSEGVGWEAKFKLTLLGKSISFNSGVDATAKEGAGLSDMVETEYYDSSPEQQYFSIGFGAETSFQLKVEAGAGASLPGANVKVVDTSLATGVKAEILVFPIRANVANDQYVIASSIIPFLAGPIGGDVYSLLMDVFTHKGPYKKEDILSCSLQASLSAGEFDVNLPILSNSDDQSQDNYTKSTINFIKPTNDTSSNISMYFPVANGAAFNKSFALKVKIKKSKIFYDPYQSAVNYQILSSKTSGSYIDILGNKLGNIQSSMMGYGLNYKTDQSNNRITYLQFIDSSNNYTYYNSLEMNKAFDILNNKYDSQTIFAQLVNYSNSFCITKNTITNYNWHFLDIAIGAGIHGELDLILSIDSYIKYPKSVGIYKNSTNYLPYYNLNNNYVCKATNKLNNPLSIWLQSINSIKSTIAYNLEKELFGTIVSFVRKKIANGVEILSKKGKKIVTIMGHGAEHIATEIRNAPSKALHYIKSTARWSKHLIWSFHIDPRFIYFYPKDNNTNNILSKVKVILYPEDNITANNSTLLGVYRLDGLHWVYVDSSWNNKYKGYEFTLNHYGYYSLIYNFSNDTNFMKKHIINLKPQQSTILYSREIKLANNATAANTEFEIQPYKCASIQGNYTIYGKSPVVIPKTLKTDQYGILHIPVKAIAEGEAFYKITSKYGYAHDAIRIVVSKGRGIDPNFKVAIQLLYEKDKLVPVNATVTLKAITSYNSTSIKWYIKTPGNDVIKKATGYTITFKPVVSSVYKVICMATDKNGFWHTAYALLPVNNPNKDSDGDGISDNIEKFFGLNPKNPNDGKKFISAVENSKNCFIKIISGQGTIENVKQLPAKYFSNIPNNLKPICIYNYTVNNMSVGGSVELQALLNIANLLDYNIYRLIGNKWIDISNGISYNTDGITYYLTDGGTNDNDGLANGKIEDTIMIAKKIATATWHDITSSLNITKSRPIFDRHHKCFFIYLNIKNTSGRDIYGPIRLVITNPTLSIDTNCPLGMQVAGKTSDGNSYFEIIPKGGVLKAGASTGNLRINFKLAKKRLSFGVRIEQLEQIGE